MSGGRSKGLSRFWLDDEEKAKKDDDLNAHGHGHKRPHAMSLPRVAQPGSWQAAAPRAPRRSLILRLLVYVCIMFLIMVFLIRAFGASSNARYLGDSRSHERPPVHPPLPPSRHAPPAQPPVQVPNKGFNDISKAKDLSGSGRHYNAPIRFPNLAGSLQAIGSTGGAEPINRNVLFAAASLRSISTLLPLACRMAAKKTNYVHFAFMHNSDVPVPELLRLNGIDEDECPLIYHDARPDEPAKSTDFRMGMASSRAMYHIAVYMHPQALFIDSTAAEASWFLAGVRDQLRSHNIALIELPDRPHLRMGWVAELDSASLAEWNRLTVDIIVNAPSSGSESIKRLLTSLSRADLSSVAVPHLTIELPAVIDQTLEEYLETFSWPSGPRTTSQPSLLTLRRRVPRMKLNPEESAARFLESFWPANPTSNHVLVLSPNVEISPHFFHYVKYALLRYRHDAGAMKAGWEHRLFGIGFGRPQTLLDGKAQFVPPPSLGNEPTINTPFLWQAPNSDAMLIVGKKWQEMHTYVSLVLARQIAAGETPAFLAKKEVGENQPAWLEYMLQVSRLRGYFTLYPSPDIANAILGAHKELYHIPEEYQKDVGSKSDSKKGDDHTKMSYRTTQYAETFDPWSAADLTTLLPNSGQLQPLGLMPMLKWDGTVTKIEQLTKAADDYAKAFRKDVGGCTGEDLERMPEWSAADLFCEAKEEKKG
ncbi:hypothetical protein NLU13_0458 [Sarocladium strictum]|uniref:Glycosyltransferase 2 n=1 Tax=Sarocladium strictum TaxID=5046 RepID=A0AA39GP34_SARSR|nr:hypothetical protein NLU13_0458 [Sarocladium strictum]